MQLTRRDTMALGLGAAALALAPARAGATLLDDAISAFTGGAAPGSSGVTLTAPEIAENGNTVPIQVEAPGAQSIALYADGNPLPDVATFHFGPMAGNHAASTRIRLAKTQNVVAVAKMADGSYAQATAAVKVTIGGCGG